MGLAKRLNVHGVLSRPLFKQQFYNSLTASEDKRAQGLPMLAPFDSLLAKY